MTLEDKRKLKWVMSLLLSDGSNAFSVLDFSNIDDEWQTIVCVAQQLQAARMGLA
jgi:hypothetical protein